MSILDAVMILLYGALFVFLANAQRRRFEPNPEMAKYIMPAVYFKLVCSIGICMLYTFYYSGGGDTYNYFLKALRIRDFVLDNPELAIKFYRATPASYDPQVYNEMMRYPVEKPATVLIMKISSVFAFFSGGSFYSTAMLMGMFSLTGMWAAFKAFAYHHPKIIKQLAISFLFIPTVCFWGSGILKDTVTLGCTGWLIWAAHSIFIRRRKLVRAGVIGLVSVVIVGGLKSYILLAILPGIVMWIFLTYRSSIKSPVLRMAITPILLVVAGGGAVYVTTLSSRIFSKFSIEGLQGKVEDTQRWHTVRDDMKGGESSHYSLGEIKDFSAGTLLRKFPDAVIVTFFEPWPWRARSPIMWPSVLESMAMLFLFGSIMLRAGPWRSLQVLVREPTALFAMSFALIFGFAIGFSTYNFGALARYKIPCLPFFVASLFIIQYYAVTLPRQIKREREEARISAEA